MDEVPTHGRPALIVVIDTEEEFDWSAPFDRGSVSVGHMRELGRLQSIFDRHGVRPVYLVDYPIATQEPAISALRPLVASGRALIGAHLHPWVSPPHEEEVNTRNSFPGNLPAALERAKIVELAAAITASFGARPLMYKAGRYGLGPNSFAILEELGFIVDLSPAPPFDFSSEGGPNFLTRGRQLRWEGPNRRVLSIPGTGALVGWAASPALSAAISAPPLRPFRLGGLLARIGALERLKLSPEGHGGEKMLRLVRALLAQGERLFVLSLHSPSIVPGNTPYARTVEQRDRLLGALDRFLHQFRHEIAGTLTDPLAIHAAYAMDAR